MLKFSLTSKITMKTFAFILVCALVYSCVKARTILPEDELVELPPEIDSNDILDIQPRASGCSVKIRGGIKDPAPLFIRPGTSEFYPFSASGAVDVESGRTIEFHCTSSFESPLSGKTHTATCVGGTRFRIDGKEHDISAIRCTSWPAFVARKSGKSCNGGTTLINVGFELTNSRFLTQYTVCFNEHEEVTRYSHHTLDSGSNYYATGVDSLNFGTAGYFAGKNVDKLYTQNTKKETIDRELGFDAARYFDSKKNVFLARGHLAAKADFVYSPEQRATFLFINAAPQWQTFNAGNWARVEDSVRALATNRRAFLECWTGVWGVTTLANRDGRQTPIYLAHDGNNNGLIPVPKLYFRVVIERSTRRGIVLIGVNNPHLSLDEIRRDYIICNDVSDRINWVTWKKTDINAGYSYACEVAEFRRKVTHLPEFSVSGLLV